MPPTIEADIMASELSFSSSHLLVPPNDLEEMRKGNMESIRANLMRLMEVEASTLSPETASQIADTSIEGSK
jgi:hypothetical protein